MARDLYEVLGVDRKATADEIKKAYRKLARSTTPIATPATPRPRSASRRSRRPTTRSPTPRSASSTTLGRHVRRLRPRGLGPGRRLRLRHRRHLLDLFGAAAAPQQAARGRDLETEVRLTFEQAIDGTEVPVTVPKQSTCPTCHGTGAKPGTGPIVCPRCGGAGVDSESQGFFSISQPCPVCGGAGQVIEDPCPTCGGSGLTMQRKRYRVRRSPPASTTGAGSGSRGKGEDGPAEGRRATST